MANEEHLEILKHGVAGWGEWRLKHRGIRPDLRNADLAHTDLINSDLTNVNLSGADLSTADLRAADLSGADLTKADLSHTYLRRAKFLFTKLRDANLSGAALDRAKFNGADLRDAYLHGADLRGADLREADLTGSDLRKADLSGTSFYRATLLGAKLNEARVGGTFFDDVDLREVEGLESIRHFGPSDISISTIYRSAGKIPEVFLRGCGVPETFITYIPSLTANALDFYSCFISYSHANKSFARRLHDALQGRGIRGWLDEHQLLPGDKIYTEVDRGIRISDKVLLCCSKDSLQSWWVDNEVETAFEKEQQFRRDRGKEVLALIPLNLDGYLFSPGCANSKAAQIRTRLAADFTGWETDNRKFEEQFERLVRALRADAGGREAPPKSKL